ncbi:MAG TPA: cupredoxin domain-containing protein [Rhodanobacteraceae bacterium]|nr:cupredoxin domain-containing protein [Rhodanobacteraceae bacterium]
MFKKFLLLAMLALPLAVAPAQPAKTATAYKVEIRNFQFMPARLTVPVGAQVTWTNKDEEPHVVVSAGGQFPQSPGLDTGDSYHTTFARPGTYTYFCSIHPQMVGTIVVK